MWVKFKKKKSTFFTELVKIKYTYGTVNVLNLVSCIKCKFNWIFFVLKNILNNETLTQLFHSCNVVNIWFIQNV